MIILANSVNMKSLLTSKEMFSSCFCDLLKRCLSVNVVAMIKIKLHILGDSVFSANGRLPYGHTMNTDINLI